MPLLNGDSVTVAYFLIRSKIRLSVLMRLAEDESMTYRPCGQASRIPTCSFRRCRPDQGAGFAQRRAGSFHLRHFPCVNVDDDR